MTKMCSECETRPAVTMIDRRLVKAKRHDLCRQCWRSGIDRRRYENQEAIEQNLREAKEAIRVRRFAAGV